MFKKTYYSRLQVNQELEFDLHWMEQTQAEFELSIFQSDVDGAKGKIRKVADACKFELTISETDKSGSENQIILFHGKKKPQPSS
jgi:hypothetical protein